jgi:hypothetical protein
VGKSYKDRGDKNFQPVGDKDDGEFDFKEYLRKKEEEEELEKENDERLKVEESLRDWYSMSEEEKEDFILNSQVEHKENK